MRQMSDATYRFPYAYPLFTKRRILTNTNRSEMGGVWYEDCIYYWWFKFLQLSEGYKKTCSSKKNKDKKKLAVYKDFGNVNDYTFQKWWKIKGNELFGVERNMKVYQSDKAINDDNNITITIPLSLPKRTLTKELKKIINKHHKAKRGRAEIKDRLTAKYTPTNDRVSALKKLHRFMEMKKKLPYDSNKTVWYECEKIDKSFAVKSYDDYATGDRVKKYENIRSYASRYVVKGANLLKKIELGVF